MPGIFWIYAVGALCLGAILGSFLNALLFRFNTGRGMGGRSRCMRCGHTLHSLDLVPILSWVFLRGKCRYCSTKISFQYPLVEAIAAVVSLKVLFLFYPAGDIWTAANIVPYFFWLFVWMTILFILVYDVRHMIIPWSASIMLFVLACASVGASIYTTGFVNPYTLVAGPLLALPFFLISLVSRGRWMGWGDSGFELSLGALLGLSGGGTALLLAVWSGATVGIVLILLGWVVKKLTPTGVFAKPLWGVTIHSEIPFAPFLALGAAVVFFFHVDFFSTLTLF